MYTYLYFRGDRGSCLFSMHSVIFVTQTLFKVARRKLELYDILPIMPPEKRRCSGSHREIPRDTGSEDHIRLGSPTKLPAGTPGKPNGSKVDWAQGQFTAEQNRCHEQTLLPASFNHHMGPRHGSSLVDLLIRSYFRLIIYCTHAFIDGKSM